MMHLTWALQMLHFIKSSLSTWRKNIVPVHVRCEQGFGAYNSEIRILSFLRHLLLHSLISQRVMPTELVIYM